MYYRNVYGSPLGRLVLIAERDALCGLWFEDHPGGSVAAGRLLGAADAGDDVPALGVARQWLDAYFAGREPGLLPPLRIEGTAFQKAVWQQLCRVPYGQTVTYGELATRVAAARGVPRLSAQAVGHALACNPLLLMQPCHRVVGAGGRLLGYAGGAERQRLLLLWERERVGRCCVE